MDLNKFLKDIDNLPEEQKASIINIIQTITTENMEKVLHKIDSLGKDTNSKIEITNSKIESVGSQIKIIFWVISMSVILLGGIILYTSR